MHPHGTAEGCGAGANEMGVLMTTQKPDPAPRAVSWAVGRYVGAAAGKTALSLPWQISDIPTYAPPPPPPPPSPQVLPLPSVS